MTREQYWEVIEEAKDPQEYDFDTRLQSQRIRKVLSQFSRGDLMDFDHYYTIDHYRAYDERLWAAGYLVSGSKTGFRSCSDDGFAYFTGWLISLGHKGFEGALEYPEIIGGFLPNIEKSPYKHGDWFEAYGEAMLWMGQSVYSEVFLEDMPDDDRAIGSTDLKGDPWDVNSVDELYPGLSFICHYPTTKGTSFLDYPLLFEYLKERKWQFVGGNTIAVSFENILTILESEFELRCIHSGQITTIARSESEAIAIIRSEKPPIANKSEMVR